MTASRSSEGFRIFAIMGILLILTFAAFNLSGAIDQLQHIQSGASHEHILLSELTAEHIDEAISDTHEQNGNNVDGVPGHHHHGDNGHSMLAQVPAALATIPLTGPRVRAVPSSFKVGLGAASLERPPKYLTASA